MAKPCYWRMRDNIPTPKTITIYALCEPGTAIVRYVGKSNDAPKRYHLHLSSARKGNKTPVGQWIRGLLSNSQRPALITLEEVPFNKFQDRERHWISFLRDEGVNLLNVSNGGGGPT